MAPAPLRLRLRQRSRTKQRRPEERIYSAEWERGSRFFVRQAKLRFWAPAPALKLAERSPVKQPLNRFEKSKQK